jgi:hypothetical protein
LFFPQKSRSGDRQGDGVSTVYRLLGCFGAFYAWLDAKIGLFFPQLLLLRWLATARSGGSVDGGDAQRLLMVGDSGAQAGGKSLLKAESACSPLVVGCPENRNRDCLLVGREV